MSGSTIYLVLLPLAVVLLGIVGFLAHVAWKYSPIITRIFEETPVFAPLRVTPEPGEDVRFRTRDGLELAGVYYPAVSPGRLGVIVFCPEFLGDRWSALPYTDGLREAGFDIFAFDFRNHGDSESDPTYNPLQWVSDLEVIDLEAALAYARSRPDADPAGVALFGVSRGGGTALCLAARDPSIWAVVTDGAFPTRGTMLSYILRWAKIYVGTGLFWRLLPHCIYQFAGWAGRISAERRHGREYPSLERAAARIAPRPWLMIHGERDVYIGPDIALDLFRCARDPKFPWIVPGAKHNRCREADPDEYRGRLVEFFRRFAPRRTPVQPEGLDGEGGANTMTSFVEATPVAVAS